MTSSLALKRGSSNKNVVEIDPPPRKKVDLTIDPAAPPLESSGKRKIMLRKQKTEGRGRPSSLKTQDNKSTSSKRGGFMSGRPLSPRGGGGGSVRGKGGVTVGSNDDGESEAAQPSPKELLSRRVGGGGGAAPDDAAGRTTTKKSALYAGGTSSRLYRETASSKRRMIPKSMRSLLKHHGGSGGGGGGGSGRSSKKVSTPVGATPVPSANNGTPATCPTTVESGGGTTTTGGGKKKKRGKDGKKEKKEKKLSPTAKRKLDFDKNALESLEQIDTHIKTNSPPRRSSSKKKGGGAAGAVVEDDNHSVNSKRSNASRKSNSSRGSSSVPPLPPPNNATRKVSNRGFRSVTRRRSRRDSLTAKSGGNNGGVASSRPPLHQAPAQTSTQKLPHGHDVLVKQHNDELLRSQRQLDQMLRSSQNNIEKHDLDDSFTSCSSVEGLTPPASPNRGGSQGSGGLEREAEEALQEIHRMSSQARLGKAASALDSLGNSHYERGEYGRAMDAYNKALRLKRRAMEVSSSSRDVGGSRSSPSGGATAGSKAGEASSEKEVEDENKTESSEKEVEDENKTESSAPPDKDSPMEKQSEPKKKETDEDEEDIGEEERQNLLSIATSLNNIGYCRQHLSSPKGTNKKGDNTGPAAVVPSPPKPKLSRSQTGQKPGPGAGPRQLSEIDNDDGKDAMAVYSESLRLKVRALGRDHISVAKTRNNIGSVHFSSGEYDSALDSYTEALRVMKLASGWNNETDISATLERLAHTRGNDDANSEENETGDLYLDMATVYSNVGDVHLVRYDSDGAVRNYKEALNIRWALLDENDPRVTRMLEKIATVTQNKVFFSMRNKHAGADDDSENGDSELMVSDDGKFVSITTACDVLRREVKADIIWVTDVERQLALECLREKVAIMREIRAMSSPGTARSVAPSSAAGDGSVVAVASEAQEGRDDSPTTAPAPESSTVEKKEAGGGGGAAAGGGVKKPQPAAGGKNGKPPSAPSRNGSNRRNTSGSRTPPQPSTPARNKSRKSPSPNPPSPRTRKPPPTPKGRKSSSSSPIPTTPKKKKPPIDREQALQDVKGRLARLRESRRNVASNASTSSNGSKAASSNGSVGSSSGSTTPIMTTGNGSSVASAAAAAGGAVVKGNLVVGDVRAPTAAVVSQPQQPPPCIVSN